MCTQRDTCETKCHRALGSRPVSEKTSPQLANQNVTQQKKMTCGRRTQRPTQSCAQTNSKKEKPQRANTLDGSAAICRQDLHCIASDQRAATHPDVRLRKTTHRVHIATRLAHVARTCKNASFHRNRTWNNVELTSQTSQRLTTENKDGSRKYQHEAVARVGACTHHKQSEKPRLFKRIHEKDRTTPRSDNCLRKTRCAMCEAVLHASMADDAETTTCERLTRKN